MDQQVKQWLDYAAQDLGVARHLFENYHPKPLEIVCYHCQQSAEKAIKAVIVSLHSCITEAVADLRPLFSAFCRKIVLPPYFISREYSLSIAKSIYSFNIIDNPNILCYYIHVIDICAVHRNADRMVCAWGFSHCTRWSGLYLSAGSMVFARKG